MVYSKRYIRICPFRFHLKTDGKEDQTQFVNLRSACPHEKTSDDDIQTFIYYYFYFCQIYIIFAIKNYFFFVFLLFILFANLIN